MSIKKQKLGGGVLTCVLVRSRNGRAIYAEKHSMSKNAMVQLYDKHQTRKVNK
jgi:hypothetical protein